MRDTRHGLRRLVRDWRFTAAAVLILGLAIGANTAIFSVVNAVLFREQAFADPDRLVNIYQNDRAGRPLIVTSYSAYMEIAEYTDIFAATMAASIPNPAPLSPRRRRPECGRRVRDGDLSRRPGTPAVARPLVRRDGGAARGSARRRPRVSGVDQACSAPIASIVGRIIRIEGVPVTIVGIGPANHRGTVDIGLGTDFWLPITAVPAIFANPAPRDAATIIAPLFVKARLREGVTVAQAKAAMDVLARRLAAENPDEFRTRGRVRAGPRHHGRSLD